MRANEFITEKWSQKYKSSINCSHPKGFSQKAHCAGKKKHNESITMESVCPDCGMCQTHGNLNEIKKGQKDANGFTRCWPGKHAVGTKKGKNGGQVRNCKPNKGVAEATGDERFDTMMGRMQKEPQIPDPQMPPTDVRDLYQWAVKNNKPYHKIFATWANREGFKSVAPALQKAGNLDSDALDYWTPDVWEMWHGSEMPPHWSKERIPDELRDYLETVFDAYDHIWTDWPTEYRQIGEPGVAEDLELEEQFNIIESMVEYWAEHHGVDSDTIWEDLESVDDQELLDESAAWHRSAGKNKNGGLNRKGVMSYRREHPGSHLQTAVTTKPSKLKPGSKAAKRRKSFCARMGGVKGPMKKPNGKPTRKALALRKWNCE